MSDWSSSPPGWRVARHTQDLTAAVFDMLKRIGAEMHDITALAVTTGPGSFTGVRIGISTIKGLGLGLQSEPAVIGVPTLAVTAAPWLSIAGTCSPPAHICAYIHAGRGRYNWAWFGPDDLLKRPGVADHEAGDVAEFAAVLAKRTHAPIWLAGELDASLYAATDELTHVTAVDPVSSMRRAGQLARIAAQHLAAGTTDTLAALQPLYLRNP